MDKQNYLSNCVMYEITEYISCNVTSSILQKIQADQYWLRDHK